VDTNEFEKRTKLGLDAIMQAFGTEDGEFSVTLFVNHHLEEIPSTYWQHHLGTENPEPAAILGLLELRSNWGDKDLENFDFSLPDEVTNYVISAHFDSNGNIDELSMES
jgi:hypothetical protein